MYTFIWPFWAQLVFKMQTTFNALLSCGLSILGFLHTLQLYFGQLYITLLKFPCSSLALITKKIMSAIEESLWTSSNQELLCFLPLANKSILGVVDLNSLYCIDSQLMTSKEVTSSRFNDKASTLGCPNTNNATSPKN